MTDRIDHAANALGMVFLGHQGPSSDPAQRYMLEAQVHATLAVAEQLRVANVMALASSRHPILRDQVASDAAASLCDYHTHEMGGYWELTPELKAVLGLD